MWIFHEISKECNSWLLNQPNVKEETLTDWILYISSQKSDKFYYRAFTRNEESHNGADWEWWVLVDESNGYCAYRFLVQAKKLKAGKDNYPLISYGNKNGMQIDLLIDSAMKCNAMPIYMYYSTSKPDITQQLKNFNFIDEDVIRWCENCINGAYISMAQSIRKKVFGSPRKMTSDIDLLNFSLGISMCDILSCGKNTPKGIMDLVNCYFLNNMKDNSPKNHGGIKYSRNSFPKYLNTLIQQKRNVPDWYESEFKHEYGDIAGVAVFDLRSES